VAKPKTSSGGASQEQGFVLFWFAGIIIISSWYFGILVCIAIGLVGALGSAWLIHRATGVTHKQCGGKGATSGLGILAAMSFGLSAAYACSKEQVYGSLIVCAVCAAYYLFEYLTSKPSE